MSTSTDALMSRLQDNIPGVFIRNHLKVLTGFFHLLESATRGQAIDEQALEFFERSTYRLQLWVENIIEGGDKEQRPLQDHELPPLDVALALHSLMLSPHRYFEDSELRFRQLKRMREYPLAMVAAALDTNNQGYDELKCRLASEYWQKRTGLAFDAIDSMENNAARSVSCPACQEAAEVPWNGHCGFTGSDFQYKCRQCGMIITHEVLRAGKFLKAIKQAKENARLCLPNTAVLIKGELDTQTRCPAIVDAVWKCFERENSQCQSLEDVVVSATIARDDIMTHITKRLSRPDLDLIAESVPILLRAFEHSYPFTQDVVDAVRHQQRFIETMYHRGWLGSGSDSPNDGDLEAAFAMYTEFLERVVTLEARQPMWQDDFLWHTHQLMPRQYREDSVRCCQLFLDHLPRGENVWPDQRTSRMMLFPPSGAYDPDHKEVGKCQSCQIFHLFLKSELVDSI